MSQFYKFAIIILFINIPLLTNACGSYQDLEKMTEGKSTLHVIVNNHTSSVKGVVVNVKIENLSFPIAPSKFRTSISNGADIAPNQSACISLVKPLLSEYTHYKVINGETKPSLKDAYVMVTLTYDNRKKQFIHFENLSYIEGTFFVAIPDKIEFNLID